MNTFTPTSGSPVDPNSSIISEIQGVLNQYQVTWNWTIDTNGNLVFTTGAYAGLQFNTNFGQSINVFLSPPGSGGQVLIVAGNGAGTSFVDQSGISPTDIKTAISFLLAPFTGGTSLAGAVSTVTKAAAQGQAATQQPLTPAVPVATGTFNSSTLLIVGAAVLAFVLLEHR